MKIKIPLRFNGQRVCIVSVHVTYGDVLVNEDVELCVVYGDDDDYKTDIRMVPIADLAEDQVELVAEAAPAPREATAQLIHDGVLVYAGKTIDGTPVWALPGNPEPYEPTAHEIAGVGDAGGRVVND